MKKIFVLLMLSAFGTICSCQKQDSTVDEQLTQRKLQLDAREEALAEGKSVLDERKKALDERERALQQREKSLAAKGQATMNAQTKTANVEDPAEMDVEGDTVTQQLSTGISDPSQAVEKAEREGKILGAQNLPASGQSHSQKQRAIDTAGISPVPQ